VKKPLAAVGKIEHIEDGRTHRYYKRHNGSAVVYTICCDCNLVHLEKFTPRRGYIAVTVWREDDLTQKFRDESRKQKRRKHG